MTNEPDAQMAWVISGADGEQARFAFLDKELAQRWAEATGDCYPDAVELITSEPDRHVWYKANKPHDTKAVHIPSGRVTVTPIASVSESVTWTATPPSNHHFSTREEAEAHGTTCLKCRTSPF